MTPRILEEMRDAHSYWNPDAAGIWIEGNLGLGFCLLANTPEARLEAQPVTSIPPGPATVLVADARLDNRSELAIHLNVDISDVDNYSDAELIVLAWQKWGQACPEYLLGDFAFVVWNASAQQLFCVRDHIGIRPFFYCLTPDFFAFASDIRVLTAIEKVPRKFSRYAISRYLCDLKFGDKKNTFIESINRLPAATTLSLTSSGVDEQTYWRPQDIPTRQFSSLQEAAAELRTLLETAVKQRLRTDYPVWSHLSGGLDSSSISVIAARHLKSIGRELRSVNWVEAPKEGEDSQYYEWGNASLISKLEDIDLENIELDSVDVYRDIKKTDIVFGDPTGLYYEGRVQNLVNQAGGRVILSGWGGDELISNHGSAVYGELFWHGRFFEAVRQIASDAWPSPRPLRRFIRIIAHKIFLPLLPRVIQNRLTAPIKPQMHAKDCIQGPLNDYLLDIDQDEEFRSGFSNREYMLSRFKNGHVQDRIEYWAGSAWQYRVQYVYPLLDKRIVEFALSAPPTFFRQKGMGRFLFREACVGILPDEIRLTSSKMEPKRVARLVHLCLSGLSEYVAFFEADKEFKESLENQPYVNLKEFFSALEQANRIPENDLLARAYAVRELLRVIGLMQIGTSLQDQE